MPHAWAVGREGTIIATHDGGEHWRRQPSGTDYHLMAVAFADSLHGWAAGLKRVGYGCESVIIGTTDGGRSWSTLRSWSTPSDAHVAPGPYDIACPDCDHVWAVGQSTNGQALITYSGDGGRTWREQRLDLRGCLRRIVFVDESHAWASTVGKRKSRLLRTADGGRSWKIGERLPMFIEQIAPLDDLRCWAAGRNLLQGQGDHSCLAFARKSEVGWAMSPSAPLVLNGVVTIGSSGVGLYGLGFAPGGVSGVFWSSTDGEQWTAASVPAHPFAVAFLDAEHGWLVGVAGYDDERHRSYGVIYATTDGGLTWKASRHRSGTPQLRDVACVS